MGAEALRRMNARLRRSRSGRFGALAVLLLAAGCILLDFPVRAENAESAAAAETAPSGLQTEEGRAEEGLEKEGFEEAGLGKEGRRLLEEAEAMLEESGRKAGEDLREALEDTIEEKVVEPVQEAAAEKAESVLEGFFRAMGENLREFFTGLFA